MPPETTTAPDAAVRSTVLAHDDERYAAMQAGRLDRLAELLDDRLTYTHSTGYTESKAQYLDTLAAGRVRYLRTERELAHFTAWADAAVMQGRLWVEAEVDGKPYRTCALFTCTWIGDGGRWRLLAWASTREKEPN